VPCPDDVSVAEAVRASGSPIVVLCGPDEAYPAAGRAARAALEDRTPNLTLVAAGRPPDDVPGAWHVDACIHRQTPLFEGITDILVSAGLRFDEGLR